MGCVQSKEYQLYCPNCNSNENVIEIIYGYPTEEGMEDFRHGLKNGRFSLFWPVRTW